MTTFGGSLRKCFFKTGTDILLKSDNPVYNICALKISRLISENQINATTALWIFKACWLFNETI